MITKCILNENDIKEKLALIFNVEIDRVILKIKKEPRGYGMNEYEENVITCEIEIPEEKDTGFPLCSKVTEIFYPKCMSLKDHKYCVNKICK